MLMPMLIFYSQIRAALLFDLNEFDSGKEPISSERCFSEPCGLASDLTHGIKQNTCAINTGRYLVYYSSTV